jgi:hypothetical protein
MRMRRGWKWLRIVSSGGLCYKQCSSVNFVLLQMHMLEEIISSHAETKLLSQIDLLLVICQILPYKAGI